MNERVPVPSDATPLYMLHTGRAVVWNTSECLMCEEPAEGGLYLLAGEPATYCPACKACWLEWSA